MHLNVHSSTIYNSQHTETTEVPINKSLSYTHTHTQSGILFMKKNEILPSAAT